MILTDFRSWGLVELRLKDDCGKYLDYAMAFSKHAFPWH